MSKEEDRADGAERLVRELGGGRGLLSTLRAAIDIGPASIFSPSVQYAIYDAAAWISASKSPKDAERRKEMLKLFAFARETFFPYPGKKLPTGLDMERWRRRELWTEQLRRQGFTDREIAKRVIDSEVAIAKGQGKAITRDAVKQSYKRALKTLTGERTLWT